MSLSKILSTGKWFFRTLVGGFRVNRNKKVSMELNNSSIGKQSTSLAEVSEPPFDYLDGKGAVSGENGNITFFIDDARTK